MSSTRFVFTSECAKYGGVIYYLHWASDGIIKIVPLYGTALYLQLLK
jgi:hypothetical protein